MSQVEEKVAAVLESSAAYIEALEAENARYKSAQTAEIEARTSKEAQALAERLKLATGEEVDLSVAKKIAASDDTEVKALINKLASADEATPMGKARPHPNAINEKTANDAGDAFVSWILNG